MSAPSSSLSNEIIELREKLKYYKPGGASKSPDRIDFPENLYIGLFGRTGSGKTSLINSIRTAADGRLRKGKWLQVASQHDAGGHTMYRRPVQITENISVIDNRGFDDPSTKQVFEELLAQLDGHRGYNEVVDWQGSDCYCPLYGQPINCAVFVLCALHDIEENTTGLTKKIDLIHMHQGRYPLAVITHVDVAHKINVEKLCTILQTYGVSDIFKVANMTNYQQKLDEDSQLSLLNFMDKCMTEGDETLTFKYIKRKGGQLMDDIRKLECARTGAQWHSAAKMRDSFEVLEREWMAALERERMTALKRVRVAVLERERSEAMEQRRMAALDRERLAALERERMAVLERERSEAQGRERSEALDRERSEAQERERMAALEREKVAVLEQERSEALVRERMATLERERSEAQGREREAALEREKMAALKRERVAVRERERSETQGRVREAALEDTIMRMKRDMQIMVTAERERQALLEDSKQGTKMPFNPKRETSPSSPPSQTSLMEQLHGASSSHTLQTSQRRTGETLVNISGAQKNFDDKLTTVAEKVGRRDEIDDLGKALGFEPENIQRYVDTNMQSVSYMGTLAMLRKWRKKQTKAKECGALKEALEEAGQIHLADELFGTS